MPRTWLLSGIPRSGTSLCCRLAGDLPDTVALSEPLNGEEHREPSRDPRSAPAYIGRFVEHARERLLSDLRAPTMLVEGRLDDQMVAPEPAEAGLRQPHARWGEMVIEKRLSARFTLVVKHNALFTALLPRLASTFPCLGLVRNPLAALASWQTVNLPIHRGRIPEGEALDPDLHRTLEREPDVLRRQILVLNWFMARFRDHLPPGNAIRYEDLVESGGRVLFRRLGHAHVPPVILGNRNDNSVYDRDTIDTLLDALLSAGGDWTHFYSAADCERVADRIRRGRPGTGAGRDAGPNPGRSLASCSSPNPALRKVLSWLGRACRPKHVGADAPATWDRLRRVWFYREYERFFGGHLKHAHYFDHVRRMPGFAPVITFGGEPGHESLLDERGRLWPAGSGGTVPCWEPEPGDVFFVEGALDWPYLIDNGLETFPNPRINLIQHVRHAHEDNVRYRFLSERAIRICVSQEVADAIAATGRTNGPILTIPNGVDVTPFEPGADGSPAGFDARPLPVTIVGYKSPELARALSERLDAEGIGHRLLAELLDRDTFLGLLSDTRIAVCLPRPEEGFYLPALEAMASGCLVVTLDCIGNRGFCHHEENCLVASHDAGSLFDTTRNALAMSDPECARMHGRARETAVEHSLEAERARFHAVLANVDRLWGEAGVEVERAGSR